VAVGFDCWRFGWDGPAEFEFSPSSGETIQIPDTDALVVNVVLAPTVAIADLQLILSPGIKAGQRFFIFATETITQLTVASSDAGVIVANNVVSLNVNDLVVFNTVSTTDKIIARVATS
jgi:hypothetical protein